MNFINAMKYVFSKFGIKGSLQRTTWRAISYAQTWARRSSIIEKWGRFGKYAIREQKSDVSEIVNDDTLMEEVF